MDVISLSCCGQSLELKLHNTMTRLAPYLWQDLCRFPIVSFPSKNLDFFCVQTDSNLCRMFQQPAPKFTISRDLPVRFALKAWDVMGTWARGKTSGADISQRTSSLLLQNGWNWKIYSRSSYLQTLWFALYTLNNNRSFLLLLIVPFKTKYPLLYTKHTYRQHVVISDLMSLTTRVYKIHNKQSIY